MARPQKTGLDYYPLDVDFLQDIKVRKIMRACGIQSVTILISLLSSIYGDQGYYVVWESDMSFLVADEVGASEGTVIEIINKAAQVGFFNKDIFEKYNVLTSKGIQKRFLEAAARRKNISLISDYLLVDLVNEYNNLNNVNINSINDSESTQRKEEKRKEKKRREEKNKKDTVDSGNFIDEDLKLIVKEYENCGFGTIDMTTRELLVELLDDYSAEWIVQAFKVCVESSKRTLKYARGILNNWKTEGGMKLGGRDGITGKSNTEKDETDWAKRAGVKSF